MPTNTQQIRQEFRKKAERLAKLEGSILAAADYSMENPANYGRKEATPKQLYVWLTAAAAAGILWKLLGNGGVLSIVFGGGCLLALYKAYMEWNNYKANHSEDREGRRITDRVTALETERKQLISDLNRMRAENPVLKGTYWWDMNKNPAVDGQRLPGKVPKADEWQYGVFNPVYLSGGKGGVYLEDMCDTEVLVDGDEVRELLKRGNDRQIAVYRDERLLSSEEKAYKVLKLYAYDRREIEEISATTTRTKIDKEAQLASYRGKLDAMEIGINALKGRNLMTNEEMYLYGKADLQRYASDGLRRAVLESQKESRIAAQGDYEEHTVYKKGFNNLSRLIFVCCADIYASIKPETNGEIAAITVPRAEQSILQMTVRSIDGKPFAGRLESYAGEDSLEEVGKVGRLSVEMAIDQLMNPKMREWLHLKKRDVLAEKPDGLDEYEWPYLIWSDQ